MALKRNKGQVLAPDPVLPHGTSRANAGQGFECKRLFGRCLGSTMRRDGGDKQCAMRAFSTVGLLCRPQCRHL